MSGEDAQFEVRRLAPDDRQWVEPFIESRWGSQEVVSRGRVHRASDLPGFAAIRGNRPVGLVTYRLVGDSCEIVTIDSLAEGLGIGSALVAEVRRAAAAAGCRRLWLITTNDNLAALRFYQKQGFSLVAMHPNALEQSRKLKPSIPTVGLDGIPLRDELELEMLLK